MLAALGATALLVKCADLALPLLLSIPVYTPALSSMGSPNMEFHYISSDFNCVVHTNSLGLRNPEISLAHKDKFRIAIIGSSYTFGWGVNDDECFVRILERNLSAKGIQVEIVNLGRNGGSPCQYALLAEEVFPLLKPDLAIVAVGQGCDVEWSGPLSTREKIQHRLWTFCPNLYSLLNGRNTPNSVASGIPAPSVPPPPPTEEQIAAQKKGVGEIAKKTYEQFNPEQRSRFDALEEKVRTLYFDGLLNVGVLMLSTGTPDLYTHAFDLDSEHNAGKISYLNEWLCAISKAASQEGAPTLVVSVPFGPFVNEHALRNYQRIGFQAVDGMLTSPAPDKAIEKAAGSLPFLSVTDAFRRQSANPRLFFELDLHLAAEGHALFAKEIEPFVEERVRACMNPVKNGTP